MVYYRNIGIHTNQFFQYLVTTDFIKGEKTLFISADMITTEVISLFLGKIGLAHESHQHYLLFEVDHSKKQRGD